MNTTSIITPFIKHFNGVQLILWDYSQRAYLYESFFMLGDHGWYSPVKFEKL